MSAQAQGLWEEETPPYERPTMVEVKATPWNGLTCVGSFSGCGGSSLGLRIAGWRVPYAVEFVPAAANTYRANSDAYVDPRDVREIQGSEILDYLWLDRGELDLFEGSPPCASFSTAGNREKGWGEVKTYSDTSQRTDDLFWQYIRLLDQMHPRAFIAENVPGLIAGGAVTEYAHKISRDLSEMGYRVDARILNASHYGVPQDRRRLIFVGFREDQGVRPDLGSLPCLPRVTLAQALEAVGPQTPEALAEVSMDRFAVGRTWRYMKEHGVTGTAGNNKGIAPICERCGKRIDTGDHSNVIASDSGFVKSAVCEDGRKAVITKLYSLLTFPRLDAPCPTITATGSQLGAASVVHPTECRKFTVAEAAAISSFPPDFIFTGDRQQQYERVGRAVPPLFMAAVGRYVRDALSAA